MRSRPTYVAPAFTLGVLMLLLAGLDSALAHAQADETAQRVRGEADVLLQQIERRDDLERCWDFAAELQQLAQQSEDAVRQAMHGHRSSDNERVRLILAHLTGTIQQEPEAAFDEAQTLLEESRDPEIRKAAAMMLGIYGWDHPFAFDELPELFEELKDDLEGPVLMAFAGSVYDVTGASVAREALEAGLRSSDVATRHEAALAFAEIGYATDILAELGRVALRPDATGRSSRALIENELISQDIESERQRHQAADSEVQGLPDYSARDFITSLILTTNRFGTVLEREVAHGRRATRTLSPEQQFEPDRMTDNFARGVCSHVDDYTVFMTGQDMLDMVSQMSGHYGGIGARVLMIDGRCIISQPFYEYPIVNEDTGEITWHMAPAYDSGLRSGDIIVSGAGVDFEGYTLNEIVDTLRGEPGSTVDVQVLRHGWDEPRTFEITRAQVTVTTAPHEMLPGGIGYIHLTQFGYDSAEHMEVALQDLERQDVKALVLDLRGNSGGSLEAVVDIADKFLDGERLITFLKGRWGRWAERDERHTQNLFEPRTMPMVVLTDGLSASGSELLAGAFQDHGRAIVIGESTFGKGTGQSFPRVFASLASEESPEDPAYLQYRRWMRLTTFYYYLPSGRSIDEVGVQPDIPLSSALTFEAMYHSAEFNDWLGWQLSEIDRLRRDRDRYLFDPVMRYMVQHFEGNEELFAKLAEFDNFDYSLYPGFEEFYQSLGTTLSRDDVRRLLRVGLETRGDRTGGVRLWVSDWRARDFVHNVQEDTVLQRGVRYLAERVDVELDKIPEYRHFAE